VWKQSTRINEKHQALLQKCYSQSQTLKNGDSDLVETNASSLLKHSVSKSLQQEYLKRICRQRV